MLLIPTKPKRRKLCQCSLCKRSRRFYRITEKLAPREREWMRNVYDEACETEEVLAEHRAYIAN